MTEYTESSMSLAETAGDLETVPTVADQATEHGAPTMSADVDMTVPTEAQTEEVPLSPEETVFCPVYKGREIALRASEREEITTLLQLGMKQRDFLPTYERLAFLAKEDGAASVNSWVEQLVKDREEVYREEAVQRYGEEAGEQFYAMGRREREQRYAARDNAHQERETASEVRQATNERLAEELIVLQEQCPQYRSFSDVPQEVVNMALREGISLLDAHNRHYVREETRRERALAESRCAAAVSTGSLVGEPSPPPSPMEAFLSGFHSRL